MQKRSQRLYELKQILEERRKEILREIERKRITIQTAEHEKTEESDMDPSRNVVFALVEMESRTLKLVEEALARFAKGTYGRCFNCGRNISEMRLRAIPFAIRCRDCEAVRKA